MGKALSVYEGTGDAVCKPRYVTEQIQNPCSEMIHRAAA